MVRPSPTFSARLQLTTKQVNGGYYKGNRTGSMGAHTEWGGYVIDYRKVRNFNCPDLKSTTLTPFVTAQVDPRILKSKRLDGRIFFEEWARENETEYRAMSEGWRKRLTEAREIPEEETKRPDGKSFLGQDGETRVDARDRPLSKAPHIDESVQAQTREDAMAQLEGSPSKPKSWLGKIFKR